MKKRIKQIVCMVGLFCLSLVVSVPVFASETSETQIADTNPTKSIVITDADELEKMIEDENLDVPDGYVLEKVEINVYNLNSEDDSNTDIGENLAEPLGIVYTIKNVVNAGEYYFPNNYDVSDWYYGPATVSEKYSLTNSVKKSVGVSVTNSTLTASVGYDVTQTYTVSKTFNTSVASGKKLNVKVYTNYQKTSFKVYNKATGNCVDDDAYTMKPIGLIFKQYTYSAS